MRYIFILLALLCVSCGTALPTIKPYKLDIQQGNVVTSKMLLQLRPGMTKSQVRFIMGTPLIQDSFHSNRWDYVYQMRQGGKLIEQRRVILDFENELLKSVRGDVIPSGDEQSKAKEAQAPTGTRVVTPIKKPEEKGLLDKLKFWEKDEAELAKEAAEKEAAAKAKQEAEEAAKNAAAKQVKDAPVPEELKSILAVPVEVPAVADRPALVEPSAVMETQSIEEVKQREAGPAVVAPTQPVASEPAPVQAPAQPEHYAPSSGMQFDRELQSGAGAAGSAPEPAAAKPRAGNNVPPTPKDLPEEDDPSYFDRILEKIGF